MAVSSNIVATYRGPGAVVSRLIGQGAREDRALAYVMAGCFIVFVAQLPRLARQAHLDGVELNMLLGGALLGWLCIAPLMLYTLALLARLIGRVLGGQGSGFGARIALFWALLAASPVLLLHGLVAGFIGTGPAHSLVGALWLALFVWFWLAGSLAHERQPQ